MWQDYEGTYQNALRDKSFLAWRDLGAQRKAENIARVCGAIAPASIVEIGCGTGSVLRALQTLNFARSYSCIDLSPSAVAFARNACPALSGRAAVGRADKLPFCDGAFDLAILSHVIEHLENPAGALFEASRIARYIVVEVPTEKVLSNFVRRQILRRPYPSIEGAGHVQFWSPSSISTFLERDTGLTILARHQDLLNDDLDAQPDNESKPKHFLKHNLRRMLPGSVYSRLLTTHATFLCAGRNGHPHD